ncbi:MMPL family transporter [Mycobacterium hackensackense]|uniref:MMPL/RND family transporter n=1 Tax=Mycobacterium hackensackense TaxID=228909 RepID=UPI002265CE23|nr:MMPL family transporter [Mycobacterium hackensackense]MCV7255379.1 MMPL family transporter [Mycobacterium hackensackense]
MSREHDAARNPRPLIPRLIKALSVPIIVLWLGAAAAVSLLVPQLEEVGKQNAVSLSPQDAPSVIAMKRIGERFGEYSSDSVLMVVLESDNPLGDDARRFYDGLVKILDDDHAHVEHVLNFWGERVSAAGSQSEDGKAAYVQLNLVGDQGSTQGERSVQAVRDIVAKSSPPPGVRVHVTGQAALVTDADEAADRSMKQITVVTVVVIAVMLLIVYRSIAATVIGLLVVLVEMSTGRGLVAVLGHFHVYGLSVFAVSVLTSLAIAAGTDYFIFLLGRYHEARNGGEDRDAAYYTAFEGVWHVILGSGLTIVGALLCLHFTRLNYFNSLAIPSALGLLVVLVMALTFAPAVLALSIRFRLLDPKRRLQTRRWRRMGTIIVRWPGPVFVVATAISLVGIVALIGYRTSYNDRDYLPSDISSVAAQTAAEQHFTSARMKPDILMLDADHDLRNPRDMLVLEKVAKSIFRVPGIARVQSITRPLGSPIEHGSVPFQMSTQGVASREMLQFIGSRLDDVLTMSDRLTEMIAILQRMHGLTVQLSDATHASLGSTQDMQETTANLRDHIADFDDFFRPLRNYFYWEPHCADIPVCWAMRSVFDGLDQMDHLADNTKSLAENFGRIDAVAPQIAAQIPPLIAITTNIRDLILTLHSTFAGLLTQLERSTDTASVMGQAFDDSKNDDMFYLPPEVFTSPDFKRGLALMVSPDGHAARFVITHDVDPATTEGISHVDPELQAAKEAVKGTPLAGATFSLGGTAATYRDIQQGAHYDLLIAASAAIILVFIVMLIITRVLVASIVIVGTVVLSLAASFGMSVLVWQYIFGIELQWLVIAVAVIVLLAVGSDYNLLVVSRFKEEISAGLNTGLIRAMGATGGVVTSAGLVFAFTMMAMVTSDLTSIGQIGTTIGLGLLFDTFIVRSLLTPSIAALLGRWFWWPMKVLPVRTRVVTVPETAGA